ncbi:MAG TPA: molybdenum cofactor guanylyltransferase, partial [Planctomycetota bacterium]|nr:molybdenum cofactor guanylyltransferase [Planctomycetota bacterium]
LAGGRSTRMGRDKALLDAGGVTLVERLVLALAPRFERILVSTGAEGLSRGLASTLERAAAAAGRDVAVVEDQREANGPLAGVEAALEEIDGSLAFFIAVDAPSVSLELIDAMWGEVEASCATACVPRWSRGLEPAHAVYSKCLLPRVRSLLDAGERSLQGLASLPAVKVLDLEDPATSRRIFGPSPPDLAALFLNLNTGPEYEAWRRELGAGPGMRPPRSSVAKDTEG